MSNKPKLKISINNDDDENKDNVEDIDKEEAEDNSNKKSETEDELLMKKVQDIVAESSTSKQSMTRFKVARIWKSSNCKRRSMKLLRIGTLSDLRSSSSRILFLELLKRMQSDYFN